LFSGLVDVIWWGMNKLKAGELLTCIGSIIQDENAAFNRLQRNSNGKVFSTPRCAFDFVDYANRRINLGH